jgi:hypothetical protein
LRDRVDAEVAAGAGLVVDDDLLAEPLASGCANARVRMSTPPPPRTVRRCGPGGSGSPGEHRRGGAHAGAKHGAECCATEQEGIGTSAM